jgi:hypothetical protein
VPRGRKADDRLASLGRRLDELEVEEANLRERRVYTDEEIVEIALIQLAYVFGGSEQAYAEYLVKDDGLPSQEANEMAGTLGRILEERRKTAVNPGHPV